MRMDHDLRAFAAALVIALSSALTATSAQV